MPDLTRKALKAKRESKYIEFKQAFDPSAPGNWCEVIKDIVAIANSGGGIIVFGLDNQGAPTQASLAPLAQTDPADITNRISKYTGPVELGFEIHELKKGGHSLIALVVQSASIPIVFQKPGTYDIGSGKQKTAFGVGTVYFRHGAKSEPGTTEDIRSAIERQLELIRKSWIKGVRKVVQAPQGSQIVAMRPLGSAGSSLGPHVAVRAVNDPSAMPVLLTRDRDKAVGVFVHEEISEAIFDEINNVVRVNRILAKGRPEFVLGPHVYYRIYAERQHVTDPSENFGLLFHSALDLYGPAMFWALGLPDELIADEFARIYLQPASRQIWTIMRLAVLMGQEFCGWLYERWHRKWKNHSQPPTFYYSFKEMRERLTISDARLVAARASASSRFSVPQEAVVMGSELLKNPQQAASLLSKACLLVFQGYTDMRRTARELDYFAYGSEICDRGSALSKSVMKAIGKQEPGDLAEQDDR
ncbi:MAG TPA: ATP-binding protein [Candidatus Acidoferrales bacterium]|nr:ATP-binding protein [Candidatus Acidoferrales bacterium]